MSAQDTLPADMELSPGAVGSYLLSSGWNLLDADAVKQVWQLSEDRHARARIMLPLDSSFVDFNRRFGEALQRLCLVNDWSVEQLAVNVLGSRSDFLFIRADQSTADGSIPLSQARDLLEGASTMLDAAARSAINPRERFSGRRPDEARDFIEDDVHFGHTQRGSFIITILARLGEDQAVMRDDSSDYLGGDEGFDWSPAAATPDLDVAIIPPFQRRVMTTLASGLQVATEVARRSDSYPLDVAVSQGLSSNLCDSLVRMTKHEGLRALDVSFQWAPAESAPAPEARSIELGRDVIPRLGDISKRLRRAPSRVRETLYGQVTRLERAEEEREGIVTIKGVIGKSARRTARIILAGDDYDRAIAAHRRRIPVTVTGDLVMDRGTYWFRGETSFEVSGFYSIPHIPPAGPSGT